MILARLSRKENAVTALVCKHWLEHSRDHIWRYVNNPKELFPLLVPVRNNTDELEPDFVRIPEPEDWRRFEPFARRVQTIVFGVIRSMSPSMASTLLRSCSRPNPIFPNLRHLLWSVNAPPTSNDSVHALFLHPGVRRLTLYNIDKNRITFEPYSLRSLFSDIISLAPHISELDIRPASPTPDAMTNLAVELVSRLPTLTKLAIDPVLLTASMIRALSKHEHLTEIVPMFDDVSWEARDPRDATGFATTSLDLAPDAFQALVTLHLDMPIQAVSRFLADQSNMSTRLQDLRVHVLDSANNAAVKELLTTIVSSCTNLLTLALVLYPPIFVYRAIHAPPPEPLDAATLEPLRRMTQLERLVIHHIVATSIQEPELLSFIESFPSMHSLFLVPRPDWRRNPRLPAPSGFGLDTLAAILQRFPRIRKLGLYLDLTLVTANPSSSLLQSSSTLPSSTLHSLHLGTTALPPNKTPAAIAFRLLALLGPQVRFFWGNKQKLRWGVPRPVYAEPSFESQLEQWAQVEKLLAFGFSVRSGVYSTDLDKPA
ncbi:unnamed protein product [Peniophora sp. CBMAI 1063]|nr:unnamed protein product [Peniophora sp. CBMAI 1063]